MPIKKIEVKTLRQQVYEKLRELILGAEILPGEIVSLRGLADQFGVSILPVREAVWQLASEKIVVVKSNKRIEVNKLTTEEFDEVLNLRLLLETKAIEQACQLRPKSAVARVERILQAMDKFVDNNHKAFIQKNDKFHQTIYSYAGSPLMLDLIRFLLSRVNPYIYLYAVHDRDLTNAVNCHQEMFAGFVDRDPHRSMAALRRDLEGAASVIRPQLTLLNSN